MLKAKDIMSKNVITVSPDMEINPAAKLLMEKKINGVVVVDEKGAIVGILCQSDLIVQQKKIPLPSLFTLLDGFFPLTSLKKLEKNVQKIAAIKVADAMTKDPVAIQPETDIGEIAALMVDKNYHTIPVTDQGRLVGVVGKEDILKTLVSD